MYCNRCRKIISFILCLFYCSPALAFDLSASVYQVVPTDSENIVQNSAGLEVTAGHKGVYLFLSGENMDLRFGGQNGAKLDLFGFGVGLERQLRHWLTIYCQGGWYEPQFSKGGKWQNHDTSNLGEGLMIYLSQRLDPPYTMNWNVYKLEYSGAIGAVVGATMRHSFGDRYSLALTPSYRYLRLDESIKARDWLNYDGHAAYRHKRDFSGWRIAGSFQIVW